VTDRQITPEAGQGLKSCSGCDDNYKGLHIPDMTQTSDSESNVTFTSYDGSTINPLNAELNPISHLLALLGAHPILHVSK
jgi:hypothetical protein